MCTPSPLTNLNVTAELDAEAVRKILKDAIEGLTGNKVTDLNWKLGTKSCAPIFIGVSFGFEVKPAAMPTIRADAA